MLFDHSTNIFLISILVGYLIFSIADGQDITSTADPDDDASSAPAAAPAAAVESLSATATESAAKVGAVTNPAGAGGTGAAPAKKKRGPISKLFGAVLGAVKGP